MPPILALGVVLLIVAIDQLSKYYVAAHLKIGQSIPVIDGIFHLTYILNAGAAFGIMQNQTLFFVLTAVLVLGSSIYFFYYLAYEERVLRLGVSMVAGGAAGNLIDRLKTGFVVDFFDFHIWPVFNIADIAIVTGTALIILAVSFYSSETSLKRK